MLCFLLLLVKAPQSRVWFSWSMIKIIASIGSINIKTTAKILGSFSRGEIFRSVDAVTTEIVLSHTSMQLSECMELSLIITTTFGSVCHRDFFSLIMQLLDFWFNNCHCPSGIFIFLYPSFFQFPPFRENSRRRMEAVNYFLYYIINVDIPSGPLQMLPKNSLHEFSKIALPI